MSVTRINEFDAAEGKDEDLFSFLTSLQEYISSSEGCESCVVLRNKDDAAKFVVIEKWRSVESHVKSLQGYPQEDMQAAMPLFGASPKGAYYED